MISGVAGIHSLLGGMTRSEMSSASTRPTMMSRFRPLMDRAGGPIRRFSDLAMTSYVIRRNREDDLAACGMAHLAGRPRAPTALPSRMTRPLYAPDVPCNDPNSSCAANEQYPPAKSIVR